MRLNGTWTPKLDDKFRLTLPAKVREILGTDLVVVCAEEPCLIVYPDAVFESVMARYDDVPTTMKSVRDYIRWIHSRADNVSPDKQGRIMLNAHLRQLAGLDKDAVVVGSGRHLEVWNPDRWTAYKSPLDATFEGFDGELIPGGLV